MNVPILTFVVALNMGMKIQSLINSNSKKLGSDRYITVSSRMVLKGILFPILFNLFDNENLISLHSIYFAM